MTEKLRLFCLKTVPNLAQNLLLLSQFLIQQLEQFPRLAPAAAFVGIAGGAGFAVRGARAG